jgi:hypothetical protein
MLDVLLEMTEAQECLKWSFPRKGEKSWVASKRLVGNDTETHKHPADKQDSPGQKKSWRARITATNYSQGL